jgi:GntR family galactonate operon transcriptional repressor
VALPPPATPHAAAPPALRTLGRTPRRGSRLGTAVVQQLVDDIVRGEYVAGSLLPPEADLCEYFDVSRTVIRESVKVVQEKGLVLIVQGKGTLVTNTRDWNMIDEVVLSSLIRQDESLAILDELITVRASLETEMAAAAAGATAAYKADIVAALEAMERVAALPGEFADADVEFHDVVMQASGNRLGRAIVTRVHDKARTSVRYVGEVSEVNTKRTVAEHRRVVDAINAGDAAAAGTAMRAHILDSWARRRPSARKFVAGR